jgi:hypothetical protein
MNTSKGRMRFTFYMLIRARVNSLLNWLLLDDGQIMLFDSGLPIERS